MYYVVGDGCVIPKKGMTIPEDVLETLAEDFDEIEDSPDGGLWLTKTYSADYDIEGAMNALAPFIESGNVELVGEDHEKWRYVFRNGKVFYQSGEIVYRQSRRSFNVTYSYVDNGSGTREESELQFDIDDGSFEDMFNELIELTYTVAKEGNETNPIIVRIEEVPYDGEEE